MCRSDQINALGTVFQQALQVFRIAFMASGNDGVGMPCQGPCLIAEVNGPERDRLRPVVLINMLIANGDSIGSVLCQLHQQAGNFTAAKNK